MKIVISAPAYNEILGALRVAGYQFVVTYGEPIPMDDVEISLRKVKIRRSSAYASMVDE
jgi:hypothetical protein